MDAQPLESPDELSALEGYAQWAESYDDDGNPLIPLEGPVVREFLGPIAGRTILDLGSGTGRHAIALANLGARVVALDQSKPMLLRARSKPGADRLQWVQHALPNPLPFRDESFDSVVMGLVAEHLAQLGDVLMDLKRLVRSGGRCVASMLHPDRTAEGQRARFIDLKTGIRRPITTIHRSKLDYKRIADESGWIFVEDRDLIVPQALAAIHPRASRYVGKPLGWVACWRA